mgnify:CR=1 FL=1
MDFFHERCGKVNCGIVENMCYGTEHNEYPIRLVAQIPMQDNMNTENLLTNAYNEFQKIVDEIVQTDIVVLEEYSTENGYDENFDVTDIHITGSRKHYFTHELKYDNGVEKTLTLPAMKFLSVRTWDKVRDYICDNLYTECAYYEEIDKLVVINNSGDTQKTIIKTAKGDVTVELAPFATKIL